MQARGVAAYRPACQGLGVSTGVGRGPQPPQPQRSQRSQPRLVARGARGKRRAPRSRRSHRAERRPSAAPCPAPRTGERSRAKPRRADPRRSGSPRSRPALAKPLRPSAATTPRSASPPGFGARPWPAVARPPAEDAWDALEVNACSLPRGHCNWCHLVVTNIILQFTVVVVSKSVRTPPCDSYPAVTLTPVGHSEKKFT